MSTTTNLVLPVVLWGKHPPTHCISCMFLTNDHKALVTGCYDGQVCIWQVNPNTFQIIPKWLLVGHTSSVICLANASIIMDNNYVISSTNSGEMCLWDIVDAKCREVVRSPFIHTNIQSYKMRQTEDLRLFCTGHYSEIIIMDPFSLEILHVLTSRDHSDWINCTYIHRPANKKDDVVLGITPTGMAMMWTLNNMADPIYENETKMLRCLNAINVISCVLHHRTLLIVCSKYWQIYDASDFSVLCSVTSPRNERWLGGNFMMGDRAIIWSDEGRGYGFTLPKNSLSDHPNYHRIADPKDCPFLYCQFIVPTEKLLPCPPTMNFHESTSLGNILVRGDSEGAIKVWIIPEVSEEQLAVMKNNRQKPIYVSPHISTSIRDTWENIKPSPIGILDQLDSEDEPDIKLSASIYLPQQSRLIVGREDGSIIIIPATQTIMLQLLHGNHQEYNDWPPHQILHAHRGRVNCLLYPHQHHPRYDKSYLVSGGIDFGVCLWDLYAGSLLHRFCVQAGEIQQFLVPPHNSSLRVQRCICSVASDHSVALLSLTERKCVVLASRHLFPVVTIKWRPLDDFMIVGCVDGTVYVWQMETGHLDRVLHGMSADEVLNACEGARATTVESGLANPAVHFFRGLRHRNINAIRHAAQRGIVQLQQQNQTKTQYQQYRCKTFPLAIQGLRTNPKDPESHVLCFDIEALVVQLLCEEYGSMSPGSLEAQGLMNTSEYEKVAALTKSASPVAAKKIADFFGRVKDKAGDVEKIIKDKDKRGIITKVKEGAESMQKHIQATAESMGMKSKTRVSSISGLDNVRMKLSESTLTMEIAQLLISLLHAWGIEKDLDTLAQLKLGLLKPMVPVSFGVISKGGYMSLLLPTLQLCLENEGPVAITDSRQDMQTRLDALTSLFTMRIHWELSSTLTTNHMLAIVAFANTLMSMNNATFFAELEKHRQKLRNRQNGNSLTEDDSSSQTHIKQGWSLVATLHCVILPDKMVQMGSTAFRRPQIQMLARRWQHHCLEIREAAQAILLAELGRLGQKGRKALVDYWCQFLPVAEVQEKHKLHSSISSQGAAADGDISLLVSQLSVTHEDEEDDEDGIEELGMRRPSSCVELRRKQMTAVVLLGVIGAQFGQEVTLSPNTKQLRKSSVAEGFGNGNNELARLTSMALTSLLLAPPSLRMPAHTGQRRAAIDLIGRGFTIWEPYLDVSKVLLGLLELCADADRLVPTMSFGLPLSPAADSCRTARHALNLIATARPAAFITTMAREVARFNSLQQNQQSAKVNNALANNVLYQAKPEILHVIEMLIKKMSSDVMDLLVETMDIILHCVEPGHLKSRGLNEVFPAICTFNQVSHCTTSRRIAVGAKNGTIAIYELRSNKNQCQIIQAHNGPVSANTFSPDGKSLVTYSCVENKLSFWQTSTGMFGLGTSHTKCIKSYSTSPIADMPHMNPLKLAKLIWINSRTVSLMLADGSETRFII